METVLLLPRHNNTFGLLDSSPQQSKLSGFSIWLWSVLLEPFLIGIPTGAHTIHFRVRSRLFVLGIFDELDSFEKATQDTGACGPFSFRFILSLFRLVLFLVHASLRMGLSLPLLLD